MLRFLLYGLILYLVINYLIKPIFSGLKGNENQQGKVHYKKREQPRDIDDGEYIDYEEVDENDK